MTSRRQKLPGSCFQKAAPGRAAHSIAAGARASKFMFLGVQKKRECLSQACHC
ncbi:hypothetical protein I79_009967 [Cricetulus griseus]|uniref:Uncharacterized protein n=1 Tax=Cricetulus griseus TaxID=10029 RepID=G3HH70_CRIGR|nr:hypothetical protein I79_009967 [Cricetulus griseus]